MPHQATDSGLFPLQKRTLDYSQKRTPLNTLTSQSTLLLLLFCSSFSALSQDSSQAEQQKWYQIEVFIFANSNPDTAWEEFWPKELRLNYAEPLAFLIESDEVDAIEQQADDASINSGPDLLNYQPDDILSADPEFNPVPLLILGEEEQQLGTAANNILRQADFRPLFHKVWRQPLTDRNASANIVILGGEHFDQHYELEGTISISVERYLHISTNLWLSTFSSNVGGDEHPWPVLPEIPTGNINAEAANTDLFTHNNLAREFSLDSQFRGLGDMQFSVDRTATLRQHRRMRSKELHYIDHPLMGLLVRITPYQKPATDDKQAL